MASFTTPLHGADGTCAGLSTLNASETCMPSCDSDFVALGVVKCDGDTGMLINTFRCEKRGLWLGFGQNAQRQGRATGAKALDVTNEGEAVARWTYTAGGDIYSSPAISADGQTIYVGSYDNKLHAVKASDGTARWAAPYATGGDIPSSPAISADGLTIYVGSNDNKLHAVKASDGTARWAAPYATGGYIDSSLSLIHI